MYLAGFVDWMPALPSIVTQLPNPNLVTTIVRVSMRREYKGHDGDGQVHEVYDEYGRGSSSLPASQMVGGGITAPGIVGSDGDDELRLQDTFSRPQRSIRLEIRFQGPQSPDAYGVPASQIIQSGQGKSAKRLKLTDIELLELARQLTLLESALYQKIRPMEYLQCAREGVGGKDKDGGSGGGIDKESVNN
ncbi:hypothetical protein F5877DRAFT_73324 [Lentinula edodes]|nr:hypothetical protein F5877DRAFT_73324 [Lentinula edodes]